MATLDNVEDRVAVLETRLDQLQRVLEERLPIPQPDEKRGWQAIVGTFAGDPLYEEAMRLGKEWREAERDSENGEET